MSFLLYLQTYCLASSVNALVNALTAVAIEAG